MPPKNSSSSAPPNCATKRESCAQKCCKIHQYESDSSFAFVRQRQRFRPGCRRQRKIRSKAVCRCGQRIPKESTRRTGCLNSQQAGHVLSPAEAIQSSGKCLQSSCLERPEEHRCAQYSRDALLFATKIQRCRASDTPRYGEKYGQRGHAPESTCRAVRSGERTERHRCGERHLKRQPASTS